MPSSPSGAWAVVSAIGLSWALPLHAETLTVATTSDKGPASLREAIDLARDGDTIVFAPSLAGRIITLADEIRISRSVWIAGPGAAVLTISGGGTSRIFTLAAGISVRIDGLTLTRGRASGQMGGGAILNLRSVLRLNGDAFTYNEARDSPAQQFTHGGAIVNLGGALVAVDSTFMFNRSVGSDGASGAVGGAVLNGDIVGSKTAPYSSAHFINCVFSGNRSVGGNGGSMPSRYSALNVGAAGAIMNGNNALLTIEDSTFTDNRALGGNGASGAAGSDWYFVGSGEGGAIDNWGQLVVRRSTFSYNQALGGSDNTSGAQGFGFVGIADAGAIQTVGTATISDTTFDHNDAIGGHGNRYVGGTAYVGWGHGGAIGNPLAADTLTLDHVSFVANRAIGGDANAGSSDDHPGAGLGGAVATFLGASTTIDRCIFDGNQAMGGTGADGLGGALSNWFGSDLTISSSSITDSLAAGGAGGSGMGGAIWNDGPSLSAGNSGLPAVLRILSGTVTGNSATTSGGGVFAVPGGLACANASISGNLAAGAPNDVNVALSSCP